MLSVTNLSVARGGLLLLSQVSFSLAPGQALMLRGANGIGKTTLLRTVAGLIPARAGEVDVMDDTMAFAGHADGVKATMSVRENLTFWASVFGAKDIEPALETFRLSSLEDRAGRDLSAGQRRRLGLARLTLTGRPLWLLDEPTVSLDADTTALFETVLKAHLKGGGAALISSHLPMNLPHDVLDLTAFKPARAALDMPEAYI